MSPTERVSQITDKRFSKYPCRHVSSLLAVISFWGWSVRTASCLIRKNSIYTCFFCSNASIYIRSPSHSKTRVCLANSVTRSRSWIYESRHAIMYSISFVCMVLIVNILVIPLKASEQVAKRSPDDLGSRPSGLDPLTLDPKANPHSSSSHPNPSRGRNSRRDGKSCQQRSDNLNPLRNPYDLPNSPTEGANLPLFRTPFVDSDEKYCPMFQYVVCDSGFDDDRVLRVATGKWRLKNCNRCK